MLSLIVWTLLITTSIKYVAVVMRADNDGEGGILALMSLLGIKHGNRVGVIAIGVLGAALLYGDGAITPAISVLSALEGLKVPVPAIAPYVVAAVGRSFWSRVFALQPPGQRAHRQAVRPDHDALVRHHRRARARRHRAPSRRAWSRSIRATASPICSRMASPAFWCSAAVFLCATGAEALYADMGHFGPRPIRIAWYGLVLPMLLLNYAGQTAVVVDGAVAGRAPIRSSSCVRRRLQVPLVVLATVATIIASQAIISGAFSMTRQAIQLGLCPRLHVTQTSAEGYGQIYVGFVNWALMALTLGLTLAFRSSDNLAAAFGIAVVADHAADLDADVPGHARGLGLEPAVEHRGRRPVRRRRSVVRHRQSDEGVRGRLGPAGGRAP